MIKKAFLTLIFLLVFSVVMGLAYSPTLRNTIWLWKEGKSGKLSGFLPTNICFDPNDNTIYVDYRGIYLVSIINAKNGEILKTIKTDDIPEGIVFVPSMNLVYVAENSGEVMVINATNNNVVKKIFVGSQAKAIAFDSMMNTIYVTDPKDDTLNVIDAFINEVVDAIKLLSPPNEMYISNNKIYVTANDEVFIINGRTNKISKTFHLYGKLEGITAFPKENKIYVVLKYEGKVVVLNAKDGKEIKIIRVGVNPYSIFFDSKHEKIYVTNFTSNTLSVISPSVDKVIDSVKCGAFPYDVVVNNEIAYVTNTYTDSVTSIDMKNKEIKKYTLGVCPQGIVSDKKYLYVCDSANDNVFVIDKKTNKVVGKIKVGFQPIDAKIDFDLNKLFVTNASSNSISVVNLKNRKIVQTIELPGDPISEPFYMAVDQKRNVVYVDEVDLDDVVAINASNGNIMWREPVGKDPSGICFDSNNDRLYVANSGDNTVSVIDCKRRITIKTIKVGKKPYGVGFSKLTNTIYVTNYSGNSIYVLGTKNNKIVKTIKNVEWFPSLMAIDEQKDIIFVITNADLDFLKNGKLQGAVSVGNLPGYVYIDKFSRKIYVSNFGDGSISVIY